MIRRVALAVALTFALHAQAPREAPPDHFAATKKLSFVLGEWQGESWSQVGPEKRTTWVEKPFYMRDGKPIQFFEMRLKKTK